MPSTMQEDLIAWTLQMLFIFNSSTNTTRHTQLRWYFKYKAIEMSRLLTIPLWIDFVLFFSLLYIEACKCVFHYLSSYCRNVYFTLSFFSNACYYLGVHLNGDLTAYHFHMLEHILKCLSKEPVLSTSSVTLQQGCLLIIIHIKSCFLCATNMRKINGQKGKDA